jgi:thymidylate kinase
VKIAIVGTHGIGKTTLAYKLAHEAKIRGYNAMILTEVARACPFPLNDGFTVDGANWIVTEQINRELQAKAQKSSFIVCDRSAYDPICYLKAKNEPMEKFEALEFFAEDWLNTYDRLVFIYSTSAQIEADGVRSTDVEFQNEVDQKFWEFFKYSTLKVSYIASSTVYDIENNTIIKEIFQ